MPVSVYEGLKDIDTALVAQPLQAQLTLWEIFISDTANEVMPSVCV
jgi:hypothetical protein